MSGRSTFRRWMRGAMGVIAVAMLGVGCGSQVTDGTAGRVGEDASMRQRNIRTGTPLVTGPVRTGAGAAVVSAGAVDLGAVGYVEEEFFLSGTAESYNATAPLGAEGFWSVTPGDRADYTTRVVVRRPLDAAEFDGTVLVEWLNVSGGLDSGPDWSYAHVEIIRSGSVWVGVSAQSVGVVGGGLPLGASRVLKVADPVRYGPLVHPGDDFSYDMFSQAGAAIWAEGSPILGGLDPRQVIAMGESQSAFRLVTYVNAVAPRADVFDGYLIHSRGAGGAALSATTPAPVPAYIRTDLAVPILQVVAETDVTTGGGLGFVLARQPDTDRLRTWEMAGTSHADVYILGLGDADVGDGATDVAMIEAMRTPSSEIYGGLFSCEFPINAGPHTYVIRAAIAELRSWVEIDEPPPTFAPLEMVDGTAFRVDRFGNALGGVRTPHVDAPLATISGLGQQGSSFCGLFGVTRPLPAELSMPAGAADFLARWDASLTDTVDVGGILPADADLISRAMGEVLGRG